MTKTTKAFDALFRDIDKLAKDDTVPKQVKQITQAEKKAKKKRRKAKKRMKRKNRK